MMQTDQQEEMEMETDTKYDATEIVGTLLGEAWQNRARIEEGLRSAIRSARSRLDEAERYLDEDFHVNGLGILQSTGMEVDRLAAEREAACMEIAKIEGMLKRSDVELEDDKTTYVEWSKERVAKTRS